MRRQKTNQNPKWFLLGLVPLVAGVGWIVDRLRKRPIPRKRAIVPADVALEPPERNQSSRIDVTGAGWQPAGGSANKEPQTGHADRHHGETSIQSSVPDEDLRSGHALENNSSEHMSFYVLLTPFVILAIAIVLLSRYQIPTQAQMLVPGGDVERGRAALQSWGCGSCHTIPGVVGAYGKVGPNLEEVGVHSFIAGHLENTPENMVIWIMNPQDISPGNGMPDTDVPEGLARDMAAYLYSLSNGQHPGSGENSFQISR